jgi:hypothetical protein
MLEIERLSAKRAGFDDNGFANYVPFEFRLGAGNAGNCRAHFECISLQIECSRVEKRRQASSRYFIGLSARMICRYADAPHPAYQNLSAKLASMKVVHNIVFRKHNSRNHRSLNMQGKRDEGKNIDYVSGITFFRTRYTPLAAPGSSVCLQWLKR